MAQETILITGGASGIGLAVVEWLLGEGKRVLVADRDAGALEAASSALSGYATHLRFEQMDVCDEAGVANVVERCEVDFGKLSGLVNCAGIGQDVPFFETSVELMRKMMEVNLVGTFIVSKAVGLKMRERKSGSIVNIASVSGIRGNLGRAAYGASKGGVIMLTRVMAVELAKVGIRVNVVAPGPVETPLVKQMHTSASREAWLSTVPQRRYSQPNEIAGTIAHLLDERRSSFVTGQVLAVDGGFTAGGLI